MIDLQTILFHPWEVLALLAVPVALTAIMGHAFLLAVKAQDSKLRRIAGAVGILTAVICLLIWKIWVTALATVLGYGLILLIFRLAGGSRR